MFGWLQGKYSVEDAQFLQLFAELSDDDDDIDTTADDDDDDDDDTTGIQSVAAAILFTDIMH